MRGPAVLLALCLATPAGAGPYDVLHIRDSLIGLAPGQVVILRTAVDNLASYNSEMVSTALILIDHRTGAETVLPLARIRFDPDPQNPQGVIARHQIARGDEYALMARAGARPLGWAANAQELGVTDDGASIRLSDQTEGAAPIPKKAAIVQINASLSAYTATMDYPRHGPVAFRDVLEGQAFGPDDCTARSAIWVASPDGAAPQMLMTMDCSQPDQHSAQVIQLWPTRP